MLSTSETVPSTRMDQGPLGNVERRERGEPGKQSLAHNACAALILACFLFGSSLALAQGDDEAEHEGHLIPFLPLASEKLRTGLLRVINHSDRNGEVEIRATDDDGSSTDAVTLSIRMNESVLLDSEDLEKGNAGKGLPNGIGTGAGSWRLSLSSSLDIEALSYSRTSDGFLTAVQDTVRREGNRHILPVFNAGDGGDVTSMLRIVNNRDQEVEVTITGTDDAGDRLAGSVSFSLPAGASRTLTSEELESGASGIEGNLGAGAGWWQLVVETEMPLIVMNLLSSGEGHLANLSTAPAMDYAPATARIFNDRAVGRRLVGDNPDLYTDFLEDGKFRERESGGSVEGSYTYRHTGANAGVVVFDYDDGGECDAFVTFASRSSGHVRTDCEDGSSHSSRTWWMVDSPADDSVTDDHGDTFATATVVDVPSTTAGELDGDGDKDYFRFEVAEATTLTVRTTGGTDTFGTLFDADRTSLDTNDDGGPSTNFQIEWDVQAGTHYVEVRGYRESTTGAYEFDVSSSTTDDSNDSDDSSIPLLSGFDASADKRSYRGIKNFGSSLALAQGDDEAEHKGHLIPFLPLASDNLRTGLLRVINHSDRNGEVEIRATDDDGSSADAVTLSIRMNESVLLDSEDLEKGNAGKGLPNGIGTGAGSWRLSLSSALDIEALSYLRASDRFLTAVQDTVWREGNRHILPAFNAGDSGDVTSMLRIVNNRDQEVEVTITGTDDAGDRLAGSVSFSLPAGASRTLTSEELESGASGIEGNLGAGAGWWQLVVETEMPLIVMNLLSSGEGHLANLSTAPAMDYAPATARIFNDRAVGRRLVGDNPDLYTDFLEDGKFRERESGGSVEGSYTYRHTGANAGVVVFDYDDGGECDAFVTFASRSSGHVRTDCEDGSSHSSRTWWMVDSPADDSVTDDHGDTFATATVVDVPSTTAGELDGDGDKDYFRFEVAEATTLTVRTTGGTDTFGTLFDADRTSLDTNDDGGPSTNFQIEWDVQAGTHYVEVRGYRESTTGAYEFDVSSSTTDDSDDSDDSSIPLLSGFDASADNWSFGGVTSPGCSSLPLTINSRIFNSVKYQIQDSSSGAWGDVAGTYSTSRICTLSRTVDSPESGTYRMIVNVTYSGSTSDYRSNTFEVTEDGDEGTIQHFDLDSDHERPTRIAFANDRLFVVDDLPWLNIDEPPPNSKVYAYQTTGERDPASDFDLTIVNSSPHGFAFANDRFFVADSWNRKVYAYQATGERDPASDFGLGSRFDQKDAKGIAFANDRFFVANSWDRWIYAYQATGERDPASDFFPVDFTNNSASGLTFADGKFYVVYRYNDNEYHSLVRAYDTSGQRASESDLLLHPDNKYPRGIAFADGEFYIADGGFNDSYSRVYVLNSTASSSPDLILSSASANPPEPLTVQSFDIQARVFNRGTGMSSATTVRFYRSTDSIISAGDTQIGTDAVGELTRQTGSDAPSLTLTAPETVGTYYYGACVGTVSGEPYTDNNCSGAVHVTVRPRVPDLVVESPSVSDDTPGNDGTFVLSASVRNGGRAASPATSLRFYRSGDSTISSTDTQVGTDAVSALAIDGVSAHSITLPAPTEAGTYYYGACVDAVAEEPSTGNNCSTHVRVRPRVPDLVVESPSVSDDTPGNDGTFVLSASVRNGGRAASPATSLRFYRSGDSTISSTDTQVGTDAVSALAIDGVSAHSITLPAPTEAGTYYYGACVDAVAEEPSTGNNCSTHVRVRPRVPDLVVESPSVSDDTPGSDGTFVLSASVRNGGRAASPATTLRFYRSDDRNISSTDAQVGMDALSALAVDGVSAHSITLPAPTEAGTYYYGACVDVVAKEPSTSNNCSRHVVVYGGGPFPTFDLRINSATLHAQDRVPIGTPIYMSATVVNRGPNASQPAQLQFSGQRTLYRDIPALDSDATTHFNSVRVGSVQRGRLTFWACIVEAPGEEDTSNNCQSRTVLYL